MHVVLLGDSILDNASYVPGERPVVDQLRGLLAGGSTSTLLAVDGSVTTDVIGQVDKVPHDATHLVVSSGGNDALQASLLVEHSKDVLEALAIAQEGFRSNYRKLVRRLSLEGKSTVVCTIYDAVPRLERWQRSALSIFNDVIIAEASMVGLRIIDLRRVCNEAGDYSALSPIEPSSKGGMKIARTIALVVQKGNFTYPRTIIF